MFPCGSDEGVGPKWRGHGLMPCVEGDQGMTLLKTVFSTDVALDCWGLGPGQGAERVFAALSFVNVAKPV